MPSFTNSLLTVAVQDSPTDAEPSRSGTHHGRTDHLRGTSRAAWFAAAIVLAQLLLLYHSIAAKLVVDWYELPDSSHGFLIPFFSLFLLWDRRKSLQQTPIVPSWGGVALIVPGLFLLLVGVLGADLFLSRVSFLVVAAGLVVLLGGWALLKEVRFALLVLLLAIPLPTLVLNQITFPLQLLVSRMSSAMLPWAGVPVLRDGNVIQLASMKLEVAEACSGIRSLVSLFTVAVLFGYFMERTTARRVVLALASIPIAVLANAARIFGTGLCVQYWNPDKAVGFFHEFSGWLMFLVSMVCLYVVHATMQWNDRRKVTA